MKFIIKEAEQRLHKARYVEAASENVPQLPKTMTLDPAHKEYQVGIKIESEERIARFKFRGASRFDEMIQIIKIEQNINYDFDLYVRNYFLSVENI